MKSSIDYARLIVLIRKVYFKLLLYIHRDHIVNYRKDISKNVSFSEEIRSSIKSCIQEAVSNINGQKKLSQSKRYNLFKIKNYYSKGGLLLGQNELTELAKYFKEKNGQAMINGIEDKLEKSTVDHVYAAIRNARQGNVFNAQMHADIAASSCEELSHFVSREKHSNFVLKVKNDLERIKLVSYNRSAQNIT